jgi:hypothetical protein
VTETTRDARLYRKMIEAVEHDTHDGCCAVLPELAEALGSTVGEARASLGRLRRAGLVATWPCSHGVTLDGRPYFGLRYAIRGASA